MGRRRKNGRAVSGWLVLDKPYDFGSTEAVSKLRWLYNANKAGHAGTLDPLATGILPIAFGEATKTVQYIQDGLKTYQFTARWGSSTTTDDLEGEELATSDKRPSLEEVEEVLPEFTGDIMQVPPIFSAIKAGGERAYDLARDGEMPELEARPIFIESLKVLKQIDEDTVVFEAVTGKGTYVRSLVRDIAKRVGTEGHVIELRRTAVGPFNEAMAITFEELTGDASPADIDRTKQDQTELDGQLLPIEQGMADYPGAVISMGEAQKLRNGQAVVLAPPAAKGVRGSNVGRVEPVLAIHHDEPVAICALDGLKLLPIKVFVM